MSNPWKGHDVPLSREFVVILKERARGLSGTEFAETYRVRRKTLNSWVSDFKAGKAVRVKSGLLRHLLVCLQLKHGEKELCLPDETIRVLDATTVVSEIDTSGATQQESYFVRANVQVLDLRTQARGPQTNANTRNSVILLDQYEIQVLSGKPRTFSFQHATTGQQINGRCLSHPDTSRWEEEAVVKDTSWKKCYRMSVDHAPLETDNHLSILTWIEFIDAFNGADKEWFESGIAYAQGSLTIVLLFAQERPCKAVKTSACQHYGQYLREIAGVGDLFSTNLLVRWYVEDPKQGMTYRIEWEW